MMRPRSFLHDQFLDRRTRSVSFKQSCLLINPLQRAQPLLASQLCIPDGRFQHVYRFVVHPERHWERVSVLSAMSEREPRGIGEAIRRAMHNLGK